MSDIIINKDEVWDIFVKVLGEKHPNIFKMKDKHPKEWKKQEKLVKELFLDTPALTMPSRDFIYLHGKIPEDYIELTITHEELHRVIQKINNVNMEDDISQGKTIPINERIDAVVDNPVLNSLLCLYFDIEPLSFMKWLSKSLGHSVFQRFIIRLLWRKWEEIYNRFINMAVMIWDES